MKLRQILLEVKISYQQDLQSDLDWSHAKRYPDIVSMYNFIKIIIKKLADLNGRNFLTGIVPKIISNSPFGGELVHSGAVAAVIDGTVFTRLIVVYIASEDNDRFDYGYCANNHHYPNPQIKLSDYIQFVLESKIFYIH